jgi:hypothetical protein
MIDLELTWQQAAGVAAVLLPASAIAARSGRPRVSRAAAFGREAGILVALFALWQFAGSFASASPAAALDRAAWIWHAERALHAPSEAALQHLFLPYPPLIQLSNLYYASLHFIVLVGCLVWLFTRHRGQYRRVRTSVVLFTGISLLIQFIPVAPPRLLPGDGMTDTAIQYGQSVYGSVAGFSADQLSAMPSVHVGWALLVAVVAVRVSGSRWRWLALGYPALTTLVVVITANHFWLDGILAAVLLGLVLAVQASAREAAPVLARAWRALPARLRPRRAGVSQAPAAAEPERLAIHIGPPARGSWEDREPQGGSHDRTGPPVLPARDL